MEEMTADQHEREARSGLELGGTLEYQTRDALRALTHAVLAVSQRIVDLQASIEADLAQR